MSASISNIESTAYIQHFLKFRMQITLKKIHPYSPFFQVLFPNIKKTAIKVKTFFFLRVNFMNRGLYFSQPSFDQSGGSVLGYWLYPAISRVRWIPEFSLCWDYKLLFFKAGTQSPCVALQWDINSACLSASSFYTHQVCPHQWNIQCMLFSVYINRGCSDRSFSLM